MALVLTSVVAAFNIDFQDIPGLQLPGYLDTTAIICGSLVGAMQAARKGLAALGVLVVAFCTGVGGGVLRDVLLQNGTPALFLHPSYQFYAVIGAFVGLFFARGAAKLNPVYSTLDTLMIGVWVILGCGKAAAQDLDPAPIVFVGTLAAVGGGLLKDVLCHELPELVQSGYFYAVAAFAAALTFTLLEQNGVALIVSQIAAIAVASGLRFISVRYEIHSLTPYDLSDRILRFLHISRY